MKIRFSVDLRDLLDAEAKMALESRLPEFAAKTLEVSLRDRGEQRQEQDRQRRVRAGTRRGDPHSIRRRGGHH